MVRDQMEAVASLHTSRRLDWLLPSWLEDAAAYDQSIDENMVTIGYTIAVNAMILFICLAFFSFYRMYDDRIFSPKSELMPERTPPRLSKSSFFGWIKELYDIDDEAIIEKGGYDILFFIRFYRLAFKIFAWFGIYAWGVLLPVNVTGHGNISNSNTFELWSMTNVEQGSGRCWSHLVGIYLLTLIFIYFLEKEFVIYAKYRHQYLRQRHAHLRTVLVEGIPNKLRSTAALATYFETLYPNAVLTVRLCQDLHTLDRLVDQRIAAVTALERTMYANHLGYKRPTVRVGNMAEEVDANRHYQQTLFDLNLAVAKEQESAKARAQFVDRMSGVDALSIIEGFLQVTEIGSLKKLLKKQSGSSNKWLPKGGKGGKDLDDPLEPSKDEPLEGIRERKKYSEEYGSYQYSDNLEDEGPEEGANVYKLSREEYCSNMFNSSSFSECWEIFKEGRHRVHHSEDGASQYLISPPEERKMFLSKAFVTFRTFTAATIARQVVHMQLVGHLAISEAPEPTDVTWVNVYTTRTNTFWRRVLAEAIVIFLIIVWVAPVTLISFAVSEDSLKSNFHFINSWCNYSGLFQSLVELLQPGALVMIMNFLPPVLTALAILEGCISFSENQFRSFDRYFTFQVINVFLVTTIAGSVIDCLKDIYDDPKSAFSLLGGSLPKMGAFFTNYIIMKAFTGLGIEIIRIPAMFSAAVKTLFTSNLTPRDRKFPYLFGAIRSMANPGWFPFAKIYAQDTLIVVVCATYACIAPLILLAGLCYFGGASYIYKHQMLYVYEPIYETGGKWWPKIARCFVVALLFAQSTMVGMMILKGTYTEIYFLAVIILGTSLYYWYISATYEPLAAQLPFDMATSIDLDQPNNSDELAGAEDYMQPSLRAGVLHPVVDFKPELSSGNLKANFAAESDDEISLI